MNQKQRTFLIIYCLLVVYCCVWVPWHVVRTPATNGLHQWRTGYGWLWSGPFGQGGLYSSPDLSIIALRLLAVTALTGAGWAATRS